MENLLAFWLEYSMEILLSVALVALLCLVWVLVLLNRHYREMMELRSAVDVYADDQSRHMDRIGAELLDGLIKGQVLTQEGMHRSVNELQGRLTENHTALQRQLLQDAGALKEALVGRFEGLQSSVSNALGDGQLKQQKSLNEVRSSVDAALAKQRESFEQRQAESLKSQQQSLQGGMEHLGKQLRETLAESSEALGKRVEKLTDSTDKRLQEISGQVEKRLTQGFEKTTETFTKVLEHLSRIDEAQKKITELSGNVVSLQEVLTDKRSRGAFGEVQLAGLVRNVMPEGSYGLQQQLSNGTRVDCLLFLPDPTGNVPIDAKFPLERFQRMMDQDLPESERNQAARQFKQDIRKHIVDISSKYLIEGETADGAVMFLPAEAVFAEIHAHFPELVEEAQRARVWLVSPTTLMAVLTTARAVIKDIATRKQVHIIQEHLRYLSADFGRFQKRMDALSNHIRQAHDDVKQVNTSARKISSRFEKIEKVELEEELETEESLKLTQKDD